MTTPSESELTDLLARARAWAAADPDATTREELERVVAEVETEILTARHLSDTFAEDTAAVMRGAGLDVWLLPRPLPTPVLAYAVRELGCVAGVMVTASHNPPEDNGYKVYLGDGSQIVSPVDAEIAARIAEVGDLTSVPRGSDWQVLGEDLLDRYLDRIVGLVADGPRDLAVVHTSLHGVGGSPVAQVLERAGFPAPYAVAEQAQPDPDFPTVAFPNPEEDGAMDLALALAEQRGADLVVANDPDADRCAAAVPTPTGWRMLRGDEVGALLATHLLRRGRTGTFATTIVSSTLLSKIAAAARPIEAAAGEALCEVGAPQPGLFVIREGAVLVNSPEDVVELLSGFDGSPRSTFREPGGTFDHAPEELAEAEPADIAALLTTAPVSVDELIRQSGAGAAAVQLALLELEIAGRLERHAAGRVSLR